MNTSCPEITLVIPNWNGIRWLPNCIEALNKQFFRSFEITVVDNGSQDGSISWLREHHPNIRIVELGKNTGFAHAVNVGIQSNTSPLIALLNTDTIVEPDWLENLHAALTGSEARIGAVCGKMLKRHQPHKIENAGDVLSWQGAAEKRGHGDNADTLDAPSEIFSCCAGAALYRRSFFNAVGYFDDAFFAYLEDVDLGLRGNLMGYRFLYEPSARVLHQGHGSELPSSRYVRLTTANRLRLFIKNIPVAILFKHMHSIVYGQWYFFICNRKPLSSLLGYWDVIRMMPRLLQQRRQISAATVLSRENIDLLLSKKMRQPGLTRAFMNKLKGIA